MDLAKELSKFNLDKISDLDEAKLMIGRLFTIIETLYQDVHLFKQTNQALRDEINRLKGEQGKPTIRPNTKPVQGDISSEHERRNAQLGQDKKGERQKKRKKARKASRTHLCQLDKRGLPDDIVFKGYERNLIPEIIFRIEYVEHVREKYYSPSNKKTYIAPLPYGYSREFSPSVQAWVVTMKHEFKSTESIIHRFLNVSGLDISTATISRMLTKKLEPFHAEKSAIFQVGTHSRTFLQTDDTLARVNGMNQHTHVFCNDRFSAYFTKPKKDRMTLLDILRMDKERQYIINDETIELLTFWKLPEKRISAVACLSSPQGYNQQEFDSVIQKLFPDKDKLKSYQKLIQDAAYIAGYHQEDCIKALVCDHASQFKFIALFLALCWIHEGRHYKKMMPVVPAHQKQLADFRCQFWLFYRKLLDYKDRPTEKKAALIHSEFDALCAFETTYSELKDRIKKTRSNKAELLYILKDPSVPLHNNESELAVRAKVRDRDIRLHTMSDEGTQANDMFLTIKDTCRKQSVVFRDYILDRLSGTNTMPSLADLIATNSIAVSPA